MDKQIVKSKFQSEISKENKHKNKIVKKKKDKKEKKMR